MTQTPKSSFKKEKYANVVLLFFFRFILSFFFLFSLCVYVCQWYLCLLSTTSDLSGDKKEVVQFFFFSDWT